MLRLATSLALAFALGTAVPLMASPLDGRIVDLTHAFGEDTIFWPTEKGFELESQHAGKTDAGYYYAANAFRTAEHGGTHVDAPIHFYEGRDTVDQIPLERLIGPGVVVDVSAACGKDRDHRISIADLAAWEKENGAIPARSIVLFRTGFGGHWPDREKYLGTAERGAEAVTKLSFPGLSAEAATWLVAERDVRAVGIDTASIDHGKSTGFETHVALFEKNVPAFENVARLEDLPATGFTVIALPMKIAGGSGGPLRIVALVGR
jgi:kynurenine formamidase